MKKGKDLRSSGNIKDTKDGLPGPAGLFASRVLEIIRAIPRGKVLTYGQVAVLADAPRAARQVGRILYFYGAHVPWQRVVNCYGGLSTYKVGSGERQRLLLEREKVVFRGDGTLDLATYLWRPTLQQVQRLRLPEEVAFALNARLPFSSFRPKQGKGGRPWHPSSTRGRSLAGPMGGKGKRLSPPKKNGKEMLP